jgi:hypothetical protein
MRIERYLANGQLAEWWDVQGPDWVHWANGAEVGRRPATAAELAAIQVDTATEQQQSNANTLRQQASNALATNQTYLGLGTPTNAQVAAQVRALTQQVDALIRLVVDQFDATT